MPDLLLRGTHVCGVLVGFSLLVCFVLALLDSRVARGGVHATLEID